jgi:CubicO group peptidase (beta-lactamase class C family)
MRISPAFRRLLTFLVLLAVLVFAAFLWYKPLLNIGTGYAAKHACSCHFMQGRELAEISEHDLNFSVLGMVALEASGNEVRGSLWGLTDRRAVYREGVGCTLINDEKKPLAEILDLEPSIGALDSLAGVGGSAAGAMKVKEAVVVGPASLTKALDFGMAPVPGGGARGLVVMQDGKIIAERYAPGYDQNTPLLGWSMTKTLTAMVLDRALQPSLSSTITPEKAVLRNHLFPEAWTDSARQLITIADLLHMNSGLHWNEAYGSLSDATIMLHEHPDMAFYAYAAPAIAPKNTTWNYSSGTTNIIAKLIDDELENETYVSLYRELFKDIAPSLLIEPSQAGLPVGSSYGWATARDWANLGQFMMQDGVWNGDTLLTPGWIDYLREPAVGSEGTYGGQTWLPGPDMPSIPKDAFMMRGFQDQRVFIIPSLRLIIARLGHGVDKSTDFDGLVRQILEDKTIE